MNLSIKQKQFCLEYLIDFNATAAAVRAGYSSNSAAEIGHENLRKPQIQSHLSKLREATGITSSVTLERTLEEISYIAFARISDVLSFSDAGVVLKNSESLDDFAVAAIAHVKSTPASTLLGLHNKMAALTLLAKYFGIDSDFDQARAVLKRYGLALLQDDESDLGWRLDRHCL